MDEAGLPEEEQESLKVLHYYLEGHMSTRSSVSFVAISNHVLDAAKSNRCVCLLRAEPDFAELRSIALGCLFDARTVPPPSQPIVGMGQGVTVGRLVDGACRAYTSLLKNQDGKAPWFENFFGLRDFMYFLKQLRRDASRTDVFKTSPDAIVRSLERNFSGVDEACFRKIVDTFVRAVLGDSATSIEVTLRNSLEIVAEALNDGGGYFDDDNAPPRYKLIIDESDDDSMSRLLQCDGLIDEDHQGLFNLSDFPEDCDVQKVNIVSGVKYACLQGRRVVLSQTETINEAFYDLFNQHFKSFTCSDGSVRNYTNIAIGSLSKPCLVDSAFQCIVHMRQSELDNAPAPFLNRFEKFRLSQSAVLSATLEAIDDPAWLGKAARAAIYHVRDLENLVGIDGFFGGVEQQTVDSIFVDMLRRVRRAGPVEEEKDEFPSSCTDDDDGDSKEIIANLRRVLCLHIPAASRDVLCSNVVDMARRRLVLDGYAVEEEDPFAPWVVSHAARDLEPSAKPLETLATQYLVHVAVARLLQIATPEMIYSNRLALPEWVRRLYFQQEHFDLAKLIDRLGSRGGRHLVYTRTTEAVRSVHNVPRDDNDDDVRAAASSSMVIVPNAIIVRLAEVQSETELRRLLDAWWRETSAHRILLLLGDMNTVTITRVNYVRLKLEQLMGNAHATMKACVLVLHFPSSTRVSMRYPALFLAGWDHIFLDTCGGAASSALKVDDFCQVGCNLRSSWGGPMPSLLECIPQILRVVASRLQFPNCARKGLRQSMSFQDRVRGLARLLARQRGGTTLEAMLCERFATLWNSSSIIADELESSAARIASGASNLPMSETVSSTLLSTFCNFLVLSIARLDDQLNCDIIADDDEVPDEVDEIFWFVAVRMPMVPLDELKLLNHVYFVQECNSSRPQFPFFSHVSSRMDEIIDALLSPSIHDAGNADAQLEIRDTWTDSRRVEQTVREKLTRVRSNDDAGVGLQDDDALTLIASIEARVRREPELWRRYMEQYVGSKLGGFGNSQALATHVGRWLEGHLEVARSILSLHIWTRAHRGDVVRLVASLQPLSEILRDEEPLPLSINDDDTALLGTISALYVSSLRAKLEETSSSRENVRTNWMAAFLHFRVNLPASSRLSAEILHNLDRCSLAAAAIMSCTDPNHAVLARLLDGGAPGFLAVEVEDFLPLLDNDELGFDARKFWDHTVFWLASPWRLCQCNDGADRTSLDGVILNAIVASRCSPSTGIVVLRQLLTTPATTRLGKFGFRTSVVDAIENHLAVSMPPMTRGDVQMYVPAWLARSSSAADSRVLPLADAMHTVFVRQLLSAHNKASSSQLAIRARQLLRYAASQSPRSARVDAILLTATCIVFVSRLAREFATETAQQGCIRALSSTASAEIIREVLTILVADQNVEWAGFFFSCLLRQMNNSTNLQALLRRASKISHLAQFEWSQPWFEAVPRGDEGTSDLAAQQRIVAEARMALDRLIADEALKENRCRYCPHCQRVVERIAGCTSMICGRDYHGNQQLQGGCGRPFNWESARRYVRNVDDMQQRVNAATSELERMTAQQGFWKDFRAFAQSLPALAVVTDAVELSLVPCASLSAMLHAASSETAAVSTAEDARRREQILAFVEVRVGLRYLEVLPAFIELYVWFAEHLDHLLTREMAMVMTVEELFSKLSPPRFAPSTCQRIKQLWDRAKDGFNRFAESQGYQIGVGACAERAERGEQGGANRLDPISDSTPVARFLSEDEDELGGNDCLFVVIRRMIEIYNACVLRVALQEDLPEIRPEVISHGSLMVGDVLPFEVDCRDRTYFESVVEASWEPAKKSFDMMLISETIRTLYISKCSRVADPTSLRRVFNFRAPVSPSRATTTTAAHDGAELATSILLALDRLGVRETGDLEASLRGMFHAASFAQLRELLLSLKMVADVISHGPGIDSTRNAATALRNATDGDLLELITSTDQNQTLFFAQMSLSDFRALVSFVRDQLAFEVFNFAHLPSRLHTPLPNGTEASLRLFKTPQLDELDEALAHAERDLAKTDDGPLGEYLVAVCGYNSADPVLAAVDALRIQNYVPLRIALQRLRKTPDPPTATESRKWSTIENVSILLPSPPSRRLWFEPSAEETAARAIQRWWHAKCVQDSRKAKAKATLVAFFASLKNKKTVASEPRPRLDELARPSSPRPPAPVRRSCEWPRSGVLALVGVVIMLLVLFAAFAPRAQPPPPRLALRPPENRLDIVLSKCEVSVHDEAIADMADMLNQIAVAAYKSNPASSRQQRAVVRHFLGSIAGPATRFVPLAGGPDAAVDLFTELRNEWLSQL